MNQPALKTDFLPARPGISPSDEYLTFRVGAEHYCVDILKVKEIRGYSEPTRLPHSQAHVKGVINLRGSVVPIIDLRTFVGIDNPTIKTETVVIVMHLDERDVGIVVDGVTDVTLILEEEVLPAPSFGDNVRERFIAGMSTQEDLMLIVIDMQALLDEFNFDLKTESNDALV